MTANVLRVPQSPAQESSPSPRPAKKQVPHTCPDGRMNEAATAEYIGVSPSTLRTWRCLGKGPSYTTRGGVRYWKDDIDAWLQEGYVDPATY